MAGRDGDDTGRVEAEGTAPATQRKGRESSMSHGIAVAVAYRPAPLSFARFQDLFQSGGGVGGRGPLWF